MYVGMKKKFFFPLSRWWPGEVIKPSAIPDNILRRKPGKCMFVMRFCGSHDFCWTYHGRALPYIPPSEGQAAWRKTGLKSNDMAYQKGIVQCIHVHVVM